MSRMMQTWEVKCWWHDGRGLCESGANSAWKVGTTPLEVLKDVCSWRGIRIDQCHDVSVCQVGEPFEAPFCIEVD